MITEFQDTHDTCDHDKLQAWRRQNDRGFVVNVKSRSNLTLHRVICPIHLGNRTWERDEEGWGTLTSSRKLCGNDVSEIKHLVVEKYVGAKLKECGHCKPT